VASILFQLESLRESCAVAAVAGKQQLHSTQPRQNSGVILANNLEKVFMQHLVSILLTFIQHLSSIYSVSLMGGGILDRL
jgi:hypothetical protein